MWGHFTILLVSLYDHYNVALQPLQVSQCCHSLSSCGHPAKLITTKWPLKWPPQMSEHVGEHARSVHLLILLQCRLYVLNKTSSSSEFIFSFSVLSFSVIYRRATKMILPIYLGIKTTRRYDSHISIILQLWHEPQTFKFVNIYINMISGFYVLPLKVS